MRFFAADGLVINFGGIRAVDGVSFEVEQGQVFTIIGPNGAGKTTIFNLVSRIYDPTAGTLVFRDEDITRVPPHEIARRGIARTFQNIELFEHATVLQNLLLGRHAHQRSRFWDELLFLPRVRALELEHREAVEKVIDFLDLQTYRDSLIVNLPYGVRKVVEMARALCTEPQLLLLDEPSSGLSVEETEGMAFWIQDIRTLLGITVLTVVGLQKAGKDLTRDTFVKGLESIKGYKDIFNGPEANFAPDKRQGASSSFLAVVKGGRWVRVTDPLTF